MKIHHLYLGLIIVITVGNLILGRYIWRNRHIPSAKAVLWTLAAVLEINLMFFILTITPSVEVAYFTARARFLGLAFLNVFVILWTLQYTQQGGWVTPRRVALLCVVPVLTQAALWVVPGGDTAFFKEWALIHSPDGYNVEYRVLAGFHDVYLIYTILTSIFCLTLLVNYALRVDSSKRMALGWVIAGTMATAAAGFLPVVIGEPPGFRLLPITMGLMSLAIGWAVVRYGTYIARPVAYDLIYVSLNDAVMLVDMRQRIQRVNPAAERVLDLSRSKLINRPLSNVMPQAADPSLFTDSPTRFEVSGRNSTVYLGKCQPMSLDGKPAGWILFLHDVTAQRRTEAQFGSREQRTKALLDTLIEMTQHSEDEVGALETEKSQVMGKFVRNGMDELRLPIQRIRAAAQSLPHRIDSQQSAAYVAQIATEADHLSGMVNTLLHTLTPPPDTPQDPEP